MGEAFRHPQLTVIVGGQTYGNPFAEVRRAATDIDGHVEHFTGRDADQFALGVFQLVMQATQDALLRAGMVILDKLCIQAGRVLKSLGVEAFVKETAFVTKYLGFDDQNTGQVGGDYIHENFPVADVNGRHSCAKCRWARVQTCKYARRTRRGGRMVGGLLIPRSSGDIGA